MDRLHLLFGILNWILITVQQLEIYRESRIVMLVYIASMGQKIVLNHFPYLEPFNCVQTNKL